MSRHDHLLRIRHILEAAQEAVGMAKDHVRDDLDTNHMLRFSLLYLVTIIGEAANMIPPEIQSRYSQVEWRKMIGMRNRLIHGYDQVDLSILWDVVETRLPPLIEQLNSVVAAQE